MKKTVKSVELDINSRTQQPETRLFNNKTYYKTIVVFMDGFTGDFSHEGKEQSVFVAGEEVEFNYDVKTYSGVQFNSLRKGGARGYSGGGGGKNWTPTTPKEAKQSAIGFTAKYICDLIAVDKIEVKDFGEYLGIFTEAINKEIDNVQ